MTYKEKLVKFLEVKDSIIYTTSNVKYINKEDIEEIESWSEEDCKKVYRYMIKTINDDDAFEFYPNSTTCPWCVFNVFCNNAYKCKECGYGKRHGFCKKSDSKYKELINNDAFILLDRNMYFEIINDIEKN